jgi:hypothetical protein
VMSALGRSDPRRSPRPAATINATAICALRYFAATATVPLPSVAEDSLSKL